MSEKQTLFFTSTPSWYDAKSKVLLGPCNCVVLQEKEPHMWTACPNCGQIVSSRKFYVPPANKNTN